MKKSELIKLRKLFNDEVQRRKRINELLKENLIREFINLSSLKPEILESDDVRGIVVKILKDFEITETNGIYVCTGTYFTDCDICYEETDYYAREVRFDSKHAEYRTYSDIENGKQIRAYFQFSNDVAKRLLAFNFEKNNVVLNPFNSNKNRNGYDEVRIDFFENSINYGQSKSKKLILEKYTRM